MPHVAKPWRGWISGAILVSVCILFFALRPAEGSTVLQWTEAQLAPRLQWAPVCDSTYHKNDTGSSAYDGVSQLNLGYDASPTLAQVDEEWHISERMLALGNFAEFLAAEGTTLSLDTVTTWGRADTLADHFARHGADFGAQTADEYANMASQFFQNSQRAGLPTKIDSQGVIRVFDPQSGAFGAFNPNGTTRTFFKPPNPPAYFGRQPGTLFP